MSINTAKALVSNYTFSSSSGTYTAITGTTLFTSATAKWDDGVSPLQTIPFTFTYNGVAYTKLGVCTNGYITLGVVPSGSTNYCGIQASDPNTIAGYATDLVGPTTGANPSTVIAGTRGTAPNRQYVIQYTDCSHYTTGTYVDHWTFQIILNETSNTVQVVWGTSIDATTMAANPCSDVPTASGDIGLLGGSVADFNVRSIINGTNTWSASVAGTTISDVCNMSSTNIPASGLTYTWTPGPIVAMSYSSATTSFLYNGASVARGTTFNPVLRIQVNTAGSLTPFNVTSLSLSTAGSTSAATDIANAKVYFTGVSSAFATTTQFGATSTNPNGTYTVTGTAALSEGINYFWVTYDIKPAATYNDILSGCCNQIIGSGTMGTKVPAVTCPAGSQTIVQTGTWTPVAATAPHDNLGLMLLLSDGTVICHTSSGGSDGDGTVWDKLTPNINGSYVNGTWSSIAAMHDTRLFFSSQVLKDGRVYVAGGEYGSGAANGEVYNPLTNVWTATPAPGGGDTVYDANSEILPDGRVLQAIVYDQTTTIYDPSTNTFSPGGTPFGNADEAAWVKLPDNSILMVDRLTVNAERYIPATNTWVTDGTVPVALYDPYGDESGAAFLLPDGRAFFLGSPGHTAYYTPSGNSSPGTWAAGPDIPSAKGTPDAAAAMMVNGKILCAVSPPPTGSNNFPTPTTFYEFDYLTNTFTAIEAPGNTASLNMGSYQTCFLDLPDGSVLYAQNQSSTSNQYYVYKPFGSPLVAGKPTINTLIQNTCSTFTITGTLFNGISEGAAYGDDWQMETNYPVIRLTSGSNVYYVRTSNWNRTGVQTGTLPDTTLFTTPAGLPAGTYQLVVTANGIASDPITFTIAPSLSSTLTPTAICSGTAFTYTPASGTNNATFTWTRPAVTGISNAAVTTPQSGNPNEVLINTTANPVSVVYVYTISAGTCTNTQNVTVVVNPAPATPTITQSGMVLTSSATTGNQWYLNGNSITGAVYQNDTATQIGIYTVVVTANGCTSAASAGTNILTIGIAEELSTNSISIYPNPSEGQFTVSFAAAKQTYKLTILNTLGELIFKEMIVDVSGEYTRTIDISAYGKGVYLLNIAGDEYQTVKKVIVY